MVVVAVAVGVAVLVTRGSDAAVAPTYTVTVSGAVVTAGQGPVAIDVYEDYLCPQCERFEERYDAEVTTALNGGKTTVRYHHVAILDQRSGPPGYSTRAANAALRAMPAEVLPTYREKLFDARPAEGSAGLTDDELIAFGTELGVTGDLAECVRGAPNAAVIAAETEAATSTRHYRLMGFSAPRPLQ